MSSCWLYSSGANKDMSPEWSLNNRPVEQLILGSFRTRRVQSAEHVRGRVTCYCAAHDLEHLIMNHKTDYQLTWDVLLAIVHVVKLITTDLYENTVARLSS